MPSPAPTDDQRQREYLRRQLTRNPMRQDEAIIRTRAALLGIAEGRAKQANPRVNRHKLRAELEEIRQVCFKGNPQELAARIDAMPLQQFPDLQALAARLRTILTSRAKLPGLIGEKGFDADFLNCFKEVLVSPARDTAVMKERVLVSFQNRKLQRKGKQMIALLQRSLPELCALESEWLGALQAERARLSKSLDGWWGSNDYESIPTEASPKSSWWSGSFWSYWWAYFLIAQLVRLLARTFGGDD